jgi:hypothetical protein
MKVLLCSLVLAFAALQTVTLVNCCCAFCAEEGMTRPAAPPTDDC